jgi:deoxyribonuclease V
MGLVLGECCRLCTPSSLVCTISKKIIKEKNKPGLCVIEPGFYSVYNYNMRHDWRVSPKDAIKIQKELAKKVEIIPLEKEINYIAGADVSLNLFSTTMYAGIEVFTFPEMIPVTHALVKTETTFPYIPGLLSFREIPALLECWEKLSLKPDLVVVDGQGIAHPRRIGIASHFGVLANVPTIGCAKNILTGNYTEPALTRGSFSHIIDKEEVIGAAVRTKDRVKPVFISPGHLITLDQSLSLIKQVTQKHRLPEPTRLAHLLVNRFRLGEIS